MTYETLYGHVTIGTEYKRGDGGRYIARLDHYESKSPDGEDGAMWYHCDGRDDSSRHYNDRPSLAESQACYYCYAGVGHTQQLHDRQISTHGHRIA